TPPRSALAALSRRPAETRRALSRVKRKPPPPYRRAVAERAVLYAWLATLLSLDWRATLRYLGGPWIFGQWAIITINLLQHQDCDPASEVDHSRHVTAPLMNRVFLNHGFNRAPH